MRKWTVGLVAIASLWAAVADAQPPRAVRGQALAPPRFGHTLDIGLVSGRVIVTPPGKKPFELGVQDQSIPIGSLLDTTGGRVDLRAAPPSAAATGTARAAKVQDAEFYKGKFTVRQPAGATVTQIRLAGGSPSVCSESAKPPAERRALSHRVLRLLGASGHGKFQTRGRYAAATVRGTIWTTTDYCDGTRVSVQRGVVSVQDFVRHTTVTVTAGHSYFANAP